MKFIFNDGGRVDAGYKGHTGDCVCRAIAIAAQLPYRQVYERLAEGNAMQRASCRSPKKSRTAAEGISVTRKWFKDYMKELGFEWVPTMLVGQGCKVHLTEGELPMGRLIVSVSKHYTAVIEGDIHDTYDPRRDGFWITPYTGQELKPGQTLTSDGKTVVWQQKRCVYGYWKFISKQ